VARAAGGATELLAEADNVDIFATDALGLEAHDTLGAFQYITNDPATQTMTYNGANELTNSVVGAITTAYTYDEWGRTISKSDGTHSATYYWRFGDKLKQYDTTFPGESSVAFQYDGLGKRRLKLQLPSGGYADADFTWYRWDAGWNMIGEYAAGSDLATTWDVGLPMLTYITSKHSGGGTFLLGLNSLISLYPAIDRLGTARAILNNSQERVSIFEYKPFGSKYLSVSVSDSTSYARLNFDDTTGMYYALNRYYSPVTARWISRDPLGSIEGPNLYRYSLNNPTLYADPMGTKSIITPEDIPPWVGKACGEKSADWDDNAIIKCLQLAARDGNSDYCHNACSCIVEHVNTDILTLPRCMNCCHSGEANGGIPGKSCTGCGVVPPHESRKGDILFCLLIAFLLVLCRRRSNDRACCHEDD
jgi:RHS repeat-associated protein